MAVFKVALGKDQVSNTPLCGFIPKHTTLSTYAQRSSTLRSHLSDETKDVHSLQRNIFYPFFGSTWKLVSVSVFIKIFNVFFSSSFLPVPQFGLLIAVWRGSGCSSCCVKKRAVMAYWFSSSRATWSWQPCFRVCSWERTSVRWSEHVRRCVVVGGILSLMVNKQTVVVLHVFWFQAYASKLICGILRLVFDACHFTEDFLKAYAVISLRLGSIQIVLNTVTPHAVEMLCSRPHREGRGFAYVRNCTVNAYF